jgi:SAM-dependent methyltransferase
VAIHPAAATGFARAAEAYERGRPGYPEAAMAWLAGFIDDGIVVDLAAGTGVFTRALAARGIEVVAVEPVAEMRALIGDAARALDGTAEAIPVAGASASAVTVAQAFHWFHGPRALAEIARVLRPGGVLVLVFNHRRMEDAIHRRIHELLAPYRGDTPAHASGDWRAALEATELFAPVDARMFPNEQVLDGDGLVDRFGSVSFVAALEPARRAELHAAFRELAGGASVTLRYWTEVEILRRRPTARLESGSVRG